MIAGLEEISEGEIYIGEKLVNDVQPKDRDIAMVFQNYALYPHMTVYDNMAFGLKLRGTPPSERSAEVRAAAGKVHLEDFLDRYPRQLSGGQRQRVALGRAIVREPAVFLIDEPLSNLDAKLRTVMRGQLKHLQRDLATTTIYVTHDQIEAMTLADRIVIMQGGRIQQSGPPAEIYARPANTFVAGFVGSPPMNLLAGTVGDGSFRHAAGSVALTGVPAGPIVLGVRPEDVRITATETGDFRGEVFASELLGDITLVSVSIGADLVNVKVGADGGRLMGEKVGIALDRSRLHFFAGEDGRRLPEPV
jgi:multiple sugar transport system ATP-binding protein